MLTVMYLLDKAKGWITAFPYKAEAVAVILALLFVAGLYRNCSRKPAPSIGMEEMQRINSQNEKERKQALDEVIKKVDDERQVRDDEIESIEKRIEASREKTGQNITAEELERLIDQYR